MLMPSWKIILLCSTIRTEVSDIYSSQDLLMIILILGLEEIYTNKVLLWQKKKNVDVFFVI